jgi:hypothetical protein
MAAKCNLSLERDRSRWVFDERDSKLVVEAEIYLKQQNAPTRAVLRLVVG